MLGSFRQLETVFWSARCDMPKYESNPQLPPTSPSDRWLCLGPCSDRTSSREDQLEMKSSWRVLIDLIGPMDSIYLISRSIDQQAITHVTIKCQGDSKPMSITIQFVIPSHSFTFTTYPFCSDILQRHLSDIDHIADLVTQRNAIALSSNVCSSNVILLVDPHMNCPLTANECC